MSWLYVRTAASWRLDENGRQFVRVLFEDFDRLRIVVTQQQDVVDHLLGNTRRQRQSTQAVIDGGFTSHHDPVEGAVIAAVEQGDLVAPGDSSSQTQCSHHCFSAGIAEGHAFDAGQFADQFCDFAGERTMPANLKSLIELRLECVNYELRRVTEEQRSKTHRHVNVLIAVDVPNTRALSSLDQEWIHQFFPQLPVAGYCAFVGKEGPVLLRQSF